MKCERTEKIAGRILNKVFLKGNKIYYIGLKERNRIPFNNGEKLQKKMLNVIKKISKVTGDKIYYIRIKD